jgi:hypothetical protein
VPEPKCISLFESLNFRTVAVASNKKNLSSVSYKNSFPFGLALQGVITGSWKKLWDPAASALSFAILVVSQQIDLLEKCD